MLLTDISPFGVSTTNGRESMDFRALEQPKSSRSKLISNEEALRMHSSLDTETLQVMFADSLTTSVLNNQLMALADASDCQQSQVGHQSLTSKTA